MYKNIWTDYALPIVLLLFCRGLILTFIFMAY